ncbi:MAG TPA: S8 family serine peptidase, partial [Micromonosporaceae bacterium]
MRRTLLAALFVGAVAVATTAATGASAATVSADRTDGYIVMLRPDANSSAVAAQHSRAFGASVGHIYQYAIHGYSAKMSATAAARIAADSRVLLVQPDSVMTTTAQTLPTGIDRADAELSPTAAIDGVDTRVNVDVAVIDTGIDLDHPDLNVYTAGAKNCSTGASANDGNGHGTHVSGTIGALDNNIGVVGMAPGARMWPVRVLNNAGSGSWADVICGIDYVAQHASEIEVANMSLGGSGSDKDACGTNKDAMHEAICAAVNAGVTFVVAAGNDDANASGFVPAAYDEVITVSALADFNGLPGGGAAATCRSDVDDTIADFSNWGADVDLIAPGV